MQKKYNNFERKTPGLIVVGIFVFANLTGCSRPQFNGKPIIVSADMDTIWLVSQKQLKNKGFELDRVDRRAGLIETHPRVSSQWFEPWTKDTATIRDTLEAGLHTMRRSVRLSIVTNKQGLYTVDCHVVVERLYNRNAFQEDAIRARDIFANSAGRMPSTFDNGNRDAQQWGYVGNDPALASLILSDINYQLNN